MKKIIKISFVSRKNIALFLLLNFISYTILLAFPQKECEGVCSIRNDNKCECSMEAEMSCCDAMETNTHKNSISSKTEVSQSSCSHEYIIHEHNNYVVPKIVDSKIELSVINEINLDSEFNSVKNFYISHNTISDIGPPIYLTVSSFLI